MEKGGSAYETIPAIDLMENRAHLTFPARDPARKVVSQSQPSTTWWKGFYNNNSIGWNRCKKWSAPKHPRASISMRRWCGYKACRLTRWHLLEVYHRWQSMTGQLRNIWSHLLDQELPIMLSPLLSLLKLCCLEPRCRNGSRTKKQVPTRKVWRRCFLEERDEGNESLTFFQMKCYLQRSPRCCRCQTQNITPGPLIYLSTCTIFVASWPCTPAVMYWSVEHFLQA